MYENNNFIHLTNLINDQLFVFILKVPTFTKKERIAL